MDFTTKNAIVTGAARGLGFAFASKLLEIGAKVLLTDINTAVLEDSYSKLKDKYGARVKYSECDVTSVENIKESFGTCERELGRPNLLINNAGGVNEKCLRSSMLLVLEAPINGTEIAIEYMGKHNGGQGGNVVNVASMTGTNIVHPIFSYYCAGKTGLVAYTKNIGHPLNYGHSGVKVQGLCPGPTDTDFLNNMQTSALYGEHLSNYITSFFDRQRQQPDEVASALVTLLEEGKPGAVMCYVKDKTPYYC